MLSCYCGRVQWDQAGARATLTATDGVATVTMIHEQGQIKVECIQCQTCARLKLPEN